MQTNQEITTRYFPAWIKEGLNKTAIKEKLLEMGVAEDEMVKLLDAFRKFRNEKRLFKGFIVTASGAFCGFISCLLTLTNPIPELYNVILFGLTSIAVGLICWGLYFIFE